MMNNPATYRRTKVTLGKGGLFKKIPWGYFPKWFYFLGGGEKPLRRGEVSLEEISFTQKGGISKRGESKERQPSNKLGAG